MNLIIYKNVLNDCRFCRYFETLKSRNSFVYKHLGGVGQKDPDMFYLNISYQSNWLFCIDQISISSLDNTHLTYHDKAVLGIKYTSIKSQKLSWLFGFCWYKYYWKGSYLNMGCGAGKLVGRKPSNSSYF